MGMQRSRLPGNHDSNGQVWIDATEKGSPGDLNLLPFDFIRIRGEKIKVK